MNIAPRGAQAPQGVIELNETGHGTPVLFLPGSYSTGAAWRALDAELPPGLRRITTSLCGYGATAETRRTGDQGMAHEVAVVEEAARRIGAPFHLVGHSFGATVALAAALEHKLDLLSLALFEPNPLTLLRQTGRRDLFEMVRAVSTAFEFAVAAGETDAAARIIDFWDGPGAYAALPGPVQAFCRTGTRTNVRDWHTDFAFDVSADAIAGLDVPVLLVRGARSNAAMVAMCDALLAARPGTRTATIEGAAHSLIQTHAAECAARLEEFLTEAH
ncbi:MAG: alpha/beta hydrolase [Silicimonas sp.]|nr:alpha/beta hydrolase [Silicimonas sp.]